MFISARMSASLRPRPSCSPTWRLRLCGLTHVVIRSPMPASPANVVASPPIATPSRVISARPRVITAARVLSPTPRPWAIPAAMATTFFSAPASSHPIDVVVEVDAEQAAGEHRLDRRADGQVLGGDHRGGGLAGHDLAGDVRSGEGGHRAARARRRRSPAVIRSNVFCSSPLDRLTIGIHGWIHFVAVSSVERTADVGTPTISSSAWRAASSRSAVAVSLRVEVRTRAGRRRWCARC